MKRHAAHTKHSLPSAARKRSSRKIDSAKHESFHLFSFSMKKYQEILQDLERRRRKLYRRLKQFGARSNLAWSDVKQGVRAAAKQMDHAVKKAMTDLR
ncbi:MAG TPA: hypothetical protein DF383_13895 [Deltaproteobacteria bacterium]|nr:hypothetical protein [Deltaproteobacteria bacterium]